MSYLLFIKLTPILDTLKTTTPLLNKVLLSWLANSYVYFRLTDAERAAAAAQGLSKPQGLGYGIGLGFALFIMQGGNGSTFIHVRIFLIPIYAEVASLVSDGSSSTLDHYSIKNPLKMTNHFAQSKDHPSFFSFENPNSNYYTYLGSFITGLSVRTAVSLFFFYPKKDISELLFSSE